MPDRFELQQRLQRAEIAQMNVLDSDTSNAKNWSLVTKVLGLVFPPGLRAARALSQRFLVDGYILGLREALGVDMNSGELGNDLVTSQRLKDRLIGIHNPPRNVWLSEEGLLVVRRGRVH